MKKIIFIDLDETLCRDDKSVGKENYEALEKASQDNIIVLCTGRRLAKILPITKGHNFCSYIIALNGSQIYDVKNKTILMEDTIDYEIVEYVYNMTHSDSIVTMCSGLIRYTNDVKYAEDILIDESILKNLKNLNIPQIVLIGNYNELLEHKKELTGKVNITNVSRDLLYENPEQEVVATFIDISSDNASKGSGIKCLLEYLNISKDDAIAIGDGLNDLSMFHEVGYKVAMENGDEFLKKEASFITKSNNESGVAYFLNNYLK